MPVQGLLGNLIWVGLGKYGKKSGSWDKLPSLQVLLFLLNRGVEMHVTCPTGTCEILPVLKADHLPGLTEMFLNCSSHTMLCISQFSSYATSHKQYRRSWCSAIFWSISWHLSSQILNLFTHTLRASSLPPSAQVNSFPISTEEKLKNLFFSHIYIFLIMLRAGKHPEISKQILNFRYWRQPHDNVRTTAEQNAGEMGLRLAVRDSKQTC